MRCGHMKNMQFANGYLLTNKVDVEFDVFCASMMYWIPGHVHRGDVVAVGHCCLRDAAVELVKKMPQPGALGHDVGVAPYSASALDREMVFCRLEDHETRVLPR